MSKENDKTKASVIRSLLGVRMDVKQNNTLDVEYAITAIVDGLIYLISRNDCEPATKVEKYSKCFGEYDTESVFECGFCPEKEKCEERTVSEAAVGDYKCFGNYQEGEGKCQFDGVVCSYRDLCKRRTKSARSNRIDKDTYYIEIARAVCKRSTCLRRRYGCVIVKNDEIIATGYNGAPRGAVNCCDIGKCMREGMVHNSGDYSECHSVHAEQNALISASRRDMIGATLYLYGEEVGTDGSFSVINASPCPICSRMIANAGIERIICSAGEVK